jgi:hypothetical protein
MQSTAIGAVEDKRPIEHDIAIRENQIQKHNFIDIVNNNGQ